jgi:hypothetical protein
MQELTLPQETNYIGIFLTLRCRVGCPYCINRYGTCSPVEELSGKGWVDGLSRIPTREDLPISLQGGEPTLHPAFYEIVDGLWRADKKVDLMTNLDFDVSEFRKKVGPDVFRRKAPYASIRVSFHPHFHDAHSLATKVNDMLNWGYSIGIWGLAHPAYKNQNRLMTKICRTYGIDFRMKDFLGEYKGEFYGKMRYQDACYGEHKEVDCRGSELLVNPAGYIFKCHRDLYANAFPTAHLLDTDLNTLKLFDWRRCKQYGECSPCDIKVKTNRLQQMGHTSVEIKEVRKDGSSDTQRS